MTMDGNAIRERSSASDLVLRLCELARTTPDTAAFSENDRDGKCQTITYGALAMRCEEFAGHVGRRIAPQARCLLVLPSGISYVTAFLGCQVANITPVPGPSAKSGEAGVTLERLEAIGRA